VLAARRNWALADRAAVANLGFQRLAIAFARKFWLSFPAASRRKWTRLSYDTDATIGRRAHHQQYERMALP